ncbi:hypothetical protein [Fervidibacillus halotolerans]|uniref:Uncharacterized protein n=1 Tax=Fervidibacillus halotolerans TaxID=2980027 RepID=A0A9E8LZE9_9BACI|nr:hypothetical protein [Fervidibacillus halotolerans]WAA12110.1 hypothetical protein OE105_11090 [Fervidibacillus halotolerans]
MSKQNKTDCFKEVLLSSYREAYTNQNLTVQDLLNQLIDKLKKLREEERC